MTWRWGKISNNYTVLHCHTYLSNGVTNIDSITSYDNYIQKAKEYNMSAIAFSEHGSVFSWVKKKEHVEDAGMKYIHAEEFYVTESIEGKIRDNYHCLLIAKNYDGVKELNTLSTAAFNREDGHYYYAPRITFEELIHTSDNIIVSTACLGGILNKGNDNIKKRYIEFLKTNKHRCYLEIQHHNVEDQKKYNLYLYELSKEIGVPLIACTDTHALNEEHMQGRKILQISKGVRFAEEDDWDLTFKSYDELVDAYRVQGCLTEDVFLEAIENTNVVASQVEAFTLDRTYKYPHLWENSLQVFKDKIREGAKRRSIYNKPNFKEYKKRINYEMKAYVHNNAIDFMLLMADIIEWCKEQDIEVGYGRGSVNGSIIAYLLGITEMDSIKHNLNFDRFMNTERVSLADIDTDFPPSRIDEVKQYIFSKHGLHCSDIVTFNTIADKGAVRDVGRALNIPLDEVSRICAALDDDESKKKVVSEYPELFKYVELVKGVVVSVGSHPCGCICCEFSLEDNIGLFTTSTSNYPISQIYMKEVDGLNYVKLDLLRLDTIEIINNTCKVASIERLTPDNVDITDVNVWNSIRDDTVGIFQWEGNTGNTYIKKLLSDENIKKFEAISSNIDRMTLLSIGNSAIRPAGASYREDLASGVVRTIGAKPIDDFLKSTFGYLVFQCQIIEFLHEYCGFTMGEADIVRRGFAKKTGTDEYIPIIKDGGYMPKSEHYIEGYVSTMEKKYGIARDKSENDILAFIQVIEDASEYLFSLNHSQPYSYEGYVSGWLRYYYPLEFLTESLNVNKDKEEKTKELCRYMTNVGIELKPPLFRYSRSGYFFDKSSKTIYKGIESLKYMNAKVADDMYELGKNEYGNFVDLLTDIFTKTSINSRQLEILIKIDFFKEFGNQSYIVAIYNFYNLLYGKKQISKEKLASNNIPESIVSKYGNETPKQFNKLDFMGLLCELIENIPNRELSIKEKIDNEHDILGIISTKDETVSKRLYYVSELEILKSITNIKLYEIYSGKTRDLKMWTSQYNKKPFAEKDVLYVTKIEKRNKKEPSGEINPKTGKKIYIDIPDKYEFWLNGYSIRNDIEGGEDYI